MYIEALNRHKSIQAAADALHLPRSTFRDRLKFEREGLPAIREFTVSEDCFVASHMFGRMFIVTKRDLTMHDESGREKWWYYLAKIDGKNRVRLGEACESRGQVLSHIVRLIPQPTSSLASIPRQRPYGLWSFTPK